MFVGVLTLNTGKSEHPTNEFQRLRSRLTSPELQEELVDAERFSMCFFTHERLKSHPTHSIYQQGSKVFFIDGRIFNLNEIVAKHQLESSKNPAEILATGYWKNGLTFIDDLVGSFSIGACDFGTQEFSFFKDHLGTRPLSVAIKDGALYFCSDLHLMSSCLFSEEVVDPAYLASRFNDYEGNYNATPHSDVYKLIPGHVLNYVDGKITQTPYWRPDEISVDRTITFSEATEKLSELIDTAIEQRLTPGLKAGAHISGGLDSSLVLDRTRSKCHAQVEFPAFTWSPEHPVFTESVPYDERENCIVQCKMSNARLFYTDITLTDYQEFIEAWRFPSEYIFEHKVVEQAKSQDISLLFSGWGGDEFIGVRDEALHYELFMTGKWTSFFNLARKRGIKPKVMHLVNNVLMPTRRKPYLRHKMNPVFEKYMKVKNQNQPISSNKEWYSSKSGFQRAMIKYRHLAQRCEDWYLLGQYHGVEYRYPLMDKRIVEYCLRLPIDLYVDATQSRPLARAVGRNTIAPQILSLDTSADYILMKNALGIQKECIAKNNHQLEAIDQLEAFNFLDTEAIHELRKNIAQGIDKRTEYFLFLLLSTLSYVRSYKD